MSLVNRRSLFGAITLISFGPIAGARAAHDVTIGDLTIGHPWSRAAGANANGVAFMSIRNSGTQPDRLVSARTPMARVVELHTHIRDGDVMRMRPVTDIPILAGQTVQLRPGGLHVMLIGLTAPLVRGATAPLTLQFERAGEVTVSLQVEAAGSSGGHRH
jgi:periplasmic copper chaperone A